MCSMQNSSVEGVFPPQRSTHPFRIIEHDAMSIQSMTSLGRVGRILAGSVDVSNLSIDKDIQLPCTSSSTQNTAVSDVTAPVNEAVSESRDSEPLIPSFKPEKPVVLQGNIFYKLLLSNLLTNSIMNINLLFGFLFKFEKRCLYHWIFINIK